MLRYRVAGSVDRQRLVMRTSPAGSARMLSSAGR